MIHYPTRIELVVILITIIPIYSKGSSTTIKSDDNIRSTPPHDTVVAPSYMPSDQIHSSNNENTNNNSTFSYIYLVIGLVCLQIMLFCYIYSKKTITDELHVLKFFSPNFFYTRSEAFEKKKRGIEKNKCLSIVSHNRTSF